MNLNSGAAVEPGSLIGSNHHGLRSPACAAVTPFDSPAAASAAAGDILSLLPVGPAHPCSVSDLMAWSGAPDRAVREELARLARDDHQPIVSLPRKRGIYLATDAEQLTHVIRGLRSRAASMRERAEGLEIAQKHLANPTQMFPEV